MTTCLLLLLALAPQSGSVSKTRPHLKATLSCGHWEPSFQHDLTGFPPILPKFNAAHMALIPKGQYRGKVMVWDILSDQTFPEWKQRWSIVDPVDSGGPTFQNYELTMPTGKGDLFCAGLTWTSAGDLLVVGGTTQYPLAVAGSTGSPKRLHPGSGPGAFIGGQLAYLWDPAAVVYGNDGWYRQPDLAIDRWYPTAVLCGDGSILVAGGITSTEHPIDEANNYEVFVQSGTSPPSGTWQSGPSGQLFAGPDDFHSWLYIYPRLYTLTTGDVFLTGMTSHSAELDHTNAPGVWVRGENSLFDGRVYETTVLMPYIPDASGNYLDEVLVLGGNAFEYPKARRISGDAPLVSHGAQSSVEISHPTAIDQSWSTVAPMSHRRKYANGILLPDGSLLVVGGNSGKRDNLPVFNAELFDGTSWTELPAQDARRTYHSTAVLLPDGRVLSAGGNSATRDYQVFVPTYLCSGDPRPVITAAPATMGYYAENPLVHTLGFEPLPAGHAVERAVLISPGAVTHHTDCNQRYVQLILDSASSDHIDVRAPANRNLVPPGYYMLFLVSSAGIPSEASWVKVQ